MDTYTEFDKKMWLELKKNSLSSSCTSNIRNNSEKFSKSTNEPISTLSLEDKIRNSISNNNIQSLENLIKAHPKDFWNTLKKEDNFVFLIKKSSLSYLDHIITLSSNSNKELLFNDKNIIKMENILMDQFDFEKQSLAHFKLFFKHSIFPVKETVSDIINNTSRIDDEKNTLLMRNWLIEDAFWKYPKLTEHLDKTWMSFPHYLISKVMMEYLKDDLTWDSEDDDDLQSLHNKDRVIQKINSFDENNNHVFSKIKRELNKEKNIEFLWRNINHYDYLKTLLKNNLFPPNKTEYGRFNIRSISWTTHFMSSSLEKEDASDIFDLFMSSKQQKQWFLEDVKNSDNWEIFESCLINEKIIDFLIDNHSNLINLETHDQEGLSLLIQLIDFQEGLFYENHAMDSNYFLGVNNVKKIQCEDIDFVMTDKLNHYIQENLQWFKENKQFFQKLDKKNSLLWNGEVISCKKYKAQLEQYFLKEKINLECEEKHIKSKRKPKM